MPAGAHPSRFEIGVDIGGTFTDIVCRETGGALYNDVYRINLRPETPVFLAPRRFRRENPERDGRGREATRTGGRAPRNGRAPFSVL